MALQGALIFSTNFFLFYLAAAHLTTGLIAVVFSTASVMTIGVKTLTMRYRPTPRVVMGAALGVLGIAIVFWPQVAGFAGSSGAARGLLLSAGGTLSFSLGSIVSARNQSCGLSGPCCTAWAMALWNSPSHPVCPGHRQWVCLRHGHTLRRLTAVPVIGRIRHCFCVLFCLVEAHPGGTRSLCHRAGFPSSPFFCQPCSKDTSGPPQPLAASPSPLSAMCWCLGKRNRRRSIESDRARRGGVYPHRR